MALMSEAVVSICPRNIDIIGLYCQCSLSAETVVDTVLAKARVVGTALLQKKVKLSKVWLMLMICLPRSLH